MKTSIQSIDTVENHLLADLPPEVLTRLSPHLKSASFVLGGVVY